MISLKEEDFNDEIIILEMTRNLFLLIIPIIYAEFLYSEILINIIFRLKNIL
jgi:hypothetical protein